MVGWIEDCPFKIEVIPAQGRTLGIAEYLLQNELPIGSEAMEAELFRKKCLTVNQVDTFNFWFKRKIVQPKRCNKSEQAHATASSLRTNRSTLNLIVTLLYISISSVNKIQVDKPVQV